MEIKILIITLLVLLMDPMATARRVRISDVTETFAIHWMIPGDETACPPPTYFKNQTRAERRGLRGPTRRSRNKTGSAWMVFAEANTRNTKKGLVQSENIRNRSRADPRNIWRIMDAID
jgi:hypothetical protein